jgi:putative endonuclease
VTHWFMYVVECRDQSLYTGITTDLQRRTRQHNRGTGAAYTAARRPVVLRAAWQFPDRSAASIAEAVFKRQSRSEKIDCIGAAASFLDGPFIQVDHVVADDPR